MVIIMREYNKEIFEIEANDDLFSEGKIGEDFLLEILKWGMQ